MALEERNNELYNKMSNSPAFKGQNMEDKQLAELKKISRALGKDSFIRPYTIMLESINDTGADITDPNINFSVPKWEYPVNILKKIRCVWTSERVLPTLNTRIFVDCEVRLTYIGTGGIVPVFTTLFATTSAPTPATFQNQSNAGNLIYTYNSQQSNNGFEDGFGIVLPQQLSGFIRPIVGSAGRYVQPNNALDLVRIDMLVEHSTTIDFKPQ